MENKSNTKIEVYELDSYHRSNQDTSLLHKPAINSGEWVESGDLIADNSSSFQGELAIGKNILVAYMPWEGYNYEDSILINERLVYDDAYTSVHIERYEIEVRESLQGSDRITRDIPDLPVSATAHLDSTGIAKIGSWIQEGDILVGKITPINPKKQTGYQRLIYKLFDKKANSVRDSSLRAPKGIKANVISVQILDYILGNSAPGNRLQRPKHSKAPKSQTKPTGNKGSKVVNSSMGKAHEHRQDTYPDRYNTTKIQTLPQQQVSNSVDTTGLNTISPTSRKVPMSQGLGAWLVSRDPNHKPILSEHTTNKSKASRALNHGLGLAPNHTATIWQNGYGAYAPRGYSNTIAISKFGIRTGAQNSLTYPWNGFIIDPINRLCLLSDKGHRKPLALGKSKAPPLNKSQKALFKRPFGETSFGQSPNGEGPIAVNNKNFIPTSVQIYLAEKRKIQVGDKMAGRHGNKGIISNILPRQDMPYLPDGTPLDIVLNPLGVPSRMNVGQIYECLLGLAGKYLGEHYKVFPFDEIYGPEASRSFVFAKLFEARQKTGIDWLFDPNSPGKIRIFDGRTAESFDQPVTVGIAYMLKLVHMVDDKIHSRNTGPYSLVTQQPLKGRAKHGGQRLGEMEVWAIEGYGAAFVLLEMLTLKSDDMTGRLKLWSDLILNKDIRLGTPESFKVLVCELQALCLDIGLYHFEPKKALPKLYATGSKSSLNNTLAYGAFGPVKNSSNKSGIVRPKHTLKEISHLMFMP